MTNQAKIRSAVAAIEAYRKAYWEHKDPQFVKEKRYRPLISQVHSTSVEGGSSFTVGIYDTWVDIDRPGHFFLGRMAVEDAQVTHKDLTVALEKLLELARVQCMKEQLFTNI